MNYDTLYNQGIKLVRGLADRDWTDHNTHDPGITILEQLCYTLTDLNYRAEFPVEDLMAEGGAKPLTSHFHPRPMLTSGPVSLQDWRMLFFDIPGVRNVWVRPVDTMDDGFKPRVFYDDIEGSLSLDPIVDIRYSEPLSIKGLYQVNFVLDRVDYLPDEKQNTIETNVKAEIFRRFQLHRNLGEDLYGINRLTPYLLTVNAEVEIAEHPDPESLMAEIYVRIHNHISPNIRFYTLQEMMAKGYQLDEVMTGPQLEHGFIDRTELKDFDVRQSVRISDLIQLIMSVKGVLAVNTLNLSVGGKIVAGTDALDPWELSIKSDYVASLAIPIKENPDPEIKLWHQGLRRTVDWTKGWAKLQTLIMEKKGGKEKMETAKLDQPPPRGRDRGVSSYQSILHQFPDIYGIGIKGLPKNSSPARQAQAKQLKAYLNFFDQLLGNAFSQLGGIRGFFGLDEKKAGHDQTYLRQSLKEEISIFEELVDLDLYEEFLKYEDVEKDENILGVKEKKELNELRQQRLTQHLLSRFSERFNDFSQEEFGVLNTMQREFLSKYPEKSYRRFTAFDYTGESWETGENVSGLEQRLCYLLCLPNAKRRNIAGLGKDDPGAFHLVEHILLRPGAGDAHQKSPILLLPFNGDEEKPPRKDPYSLQISFVFPNWVDRFDQDGSYWQFLTRTIREQTPAHLKIYIQRLTKQEMTTFEEAYRDWLVQLNTYKDPLTENGVSV